MVLTMRWHDTVAAISAIALVGCGGGGFIDPNGGAMVDGMEVNRRAVSVPAGWAQDGDDNTIAKYYRYCLIPVANIQECADLADSQGHIVFQFNPDEEKNCGTLTQNDKPETLSGWTVYKKEGVWPQVGKTKVVCTEEIWKKDFEATHMECQQKAIDDGYAHYNFDSRRNLCAMCDQEFVGDHPSQWRIYSNTASPAATTTTTTTLDFAPFVGTWSFNMRRTPTFGTRYKDVTYEVDSTGMVNVVGSDGGKPSEQLQGTKHKDCEGKPCLLANRLWGGLGVGYDLLIRDGDHLRVRHYFQGHNKCCNCKVETSFCCEVQSVPQGGTDSTDDVGEETTAVGWSRDGADDLVCTRQEACFSYDVGSTQECADIAGGKGDIFFQYIPEKKMCGSDKTCDKPKKWVGAKIHRKDDIWPQSGTVGMVCAEEDHDNFGTLVNSQKECQDLAENGGQHYYNYNVKQNMCAVCDKKFHRYEHAKTQLKWSIFCKGGSEITTTTTTTNEFGLLSEYCPFAGTWSWQVDIAGHKPTYVIDGLGRVAAVGTDGKSTSKLLLNSNHFGCEGKSPCARVNRLWAGPGFGFDILIVEEGRLRLKHYFYPTKSSCDDRPQATFCCEFVSSAPIQVPSGCESLP